MKKVLPLPLILITAFLCVSFTAKKPYVINPYLGQRCPPDMEFISGNDSIASFFISKSQETNMAYVIYTDWLQTVFVSYPDVAKHAEPHTCTLTELHRFNDPAIQYSLRHPALAYYPVTGLDWMQIQDYMGWKTDRMNEYILYSVYGWDKYNEHHIVDENNFNSEAYLAGQYSSNIPQDGYASYSYYSYNKDRISLSEQKPYFFTGLRLPTEEEFEYAARTTFKNDYLSDNNNTPYGNPYYLSAFAFKSAKNNSSPITEYLKNVDPKESPEMNRIKGGSCYMTSMYGISNMGNNVKEWLMDIYTDQKRHYGRYEDIFWQNGFTNPDSIGRIYDQYGELEEKDSAGRLHFRIMGVKNNGKDFRVNPYGSSISYRVTVNPNPDSSKTARELAPNIARQYMQNQYGYMMEFLPHYKGYTLQYVQQVKAIYKNRYCAIEDSMTQVFFQQIMASGDFSKIFTYYVDSSRLISRVVKSGTWKNPSVTAREKRRETDADSETGFRCVMQYNGFPVQQKYLVKWSGKKK